MPFTHGFSSSSLLKNAKMKIVQKEKSWHGTAWQIVKETQNIRQEIEIRSINK